MKKLFIFVIFVILLTSFALAERFENNYVRYGTIDSSGNLHETSTPITNVNVLGYVCSNSACSSVSGTLWGGNVLTTSGDFIQLTYPTNLLSSFGYGVYFYKDGYIPYEVSADWWGTYSGDPQGPFYDYLTKKQVCYPGINLLQTQTSAGVISVNVSVHSPIENAGPLDYTPSSLIPYYSASVSVELEVLKSNSAYYSENKSVIIPFSGDKVVSFSFPAEAGTYSIRTYTSTSDAKCIDYTPDYENKTIIIACSQNLDCGTNSYINQPICSNGDVYQDYRTFTCNNAGTALSSCSNSTNSILKEACSSGCSNGFCIPPVIACSQNSDCGTDHYTGDNFCSNGNIARNLISFICNNAGTALSSCSNSTSIVEIQECENDCSNSQCNALNETNAPIVTLVSPLNNQIFNASQIGFRFNVTDQSSIKSCSANVSGNLYQNTSEIIKNNINTITVNLSIGNYSAYVFCFDAFDNKGISNQINFSVVNISGQITCSQNSDCGTNSYINQPTCSNGDVYQDYRTFTCNNAGTALSSCSNSTNSTLKQACSSGCSNGKCKSSHNNWGGGNYTDFEASEDISQPIKMSSGKKNINDSGISLNSSGPVKKSFNFIWILLGLLALLILLILIILIVMSRRD